MVVALLDRGGSRLKGIAATDPSGNGSAKGVAVAAVMPANRRREVEGERREGGEVG